MARRLAAGATLVLASHNPGKLREIEALVRPLGVNVASAAAMGLPEPVEDAPDFAGNARIKALAAARATGLPALSDDSGFCVAALDGAPGVLSARWAGPSKDFAAAMATVNDRIGASQDRRAWFIAALCLGWPDGHTETFVGRIDGHAVWPPRGDRGFGYDPMFVPTGFTPTGFTSTGFVATGASPAGFMRAGLQPLGSGQTGTELTFGEMEPAAKHAVSHRARAFAQVLAACFTQSPAAAASGKLTA